MHRDSADLEEGRANKVLLDLRVIQDSPAHPVRKESVVHQERKVFED